ncbi:MAG: glycosyltransferase family 2 protein [Pseudonocardiaceae bacterium]
MISVVIPTVDRADLLSAALRSLAEQTYLDFEAIVVNDGGDSVAHAIDSIRPRFPVNLVDTPHRCGVSHARNVGIEYASGQHIAFLDDDDVFLPWHLATAATALDSGELDCVYLGALVSDRRIATLPPDWHVMRRKAYPFNDRFLLVANYIHTGSVVARNFRSSSVRFDESLSHCEDWNMWLSLRHCLGYRLGFVDKVSSVYHQVSDIEGLVSHGQSVTPSPFSIARQLIYSRWCVGDSHVGAYREWMTGFDAYCNEMVEQGIDVPLAIFDRAVRELHAGFIAGRTPARDLIPRLFTGDG